MTNDPRLIVKDSVKEKQTFKTALEWLFSKSERVPNDKTLKFSLVTNVIYFEL